MEKKIHSQYFEDNPTVSFRLKKEDRVKLEEIAKEEGKTPGQWVRDFLNGIVEERESEEESYWRGYNEAAQDFQIKFACASCGIPILISPESVKKLLEELNPNGWICSSCKENDSNQY